MKRLLVLFVLFGCGDDSTVNNSTSESTVTFCEEIPIESIEGQEVTIVQCGGSNNEIEDNEIDEFVGVQLFPGDDPNDE